jgi:glycosyltransferase involved in cell wall biosynthesis
LSHPHRPIQVLTINHPGVWGSKVDIFGYNVNLSLVGDGELKANMEELIQTLGLNENVKMFGWIKDRRKLLEILRESDILVFTSKPGEGLGLTILEAMSQGLPVIATKCGGPEEVIEDGINGYLVDYSTDEDIVNQFVDRIIEFLIKNPRIYEQMSKNNIEKAREWTMEKFSEIQKERVIKLIHERHERQN